jgi:hypothetical protein
MELSFETLQSDLTIRLSKEEGAWLVSILPQLQIDNPKTMTRQELKTSYEAAGLPDFELFWDNKPISNLYKAGLLQL